VIGIRIGRGVRRVRGGDAPSASLGDLGTSTFSRFSADTTFTVPGTGFVAGATVRWGGVALPTVVNSAAQLTATVSEALLWTLGDVAVTVVNGAGGPPVAGERTATVAWPANAEWWYDAALGRTMNGANVQVLANQTPKTGRNIQQLDGAKQLPFTAVDAAYNGQPTLTVTGASFLQSPTPWVTPIPAGTRIVSFTVGAFGALNGSQILADGYDGTTRAYLGFSTSQGNKLYMGRTVLLLDGVFSSTAKQFLRADYNGAASALYSASIATPLMTGDGGGTAAAFLGRTIGAAYTGSGLMLAGGKFAIDCGFSSPTAAQVASVMRYCANRFGITLT
jgi:hypothetical protein